MGPLELTGRGEKMENCAELCIWSCGGHPTHHGMAKPVYQCVLPWARSPHCSEILLWQQKASHTRPWSPIPKAAAAAFPSINIWTPGRRNRGKNNSRIHLVPWKIYVRFCYHCNLVGAFLTMLEHRTTLWKERSQQL